MLKEQVKAKVATFNIYEDEGYLESLQPLSKKLADLYPTSKFDVKALGNFVAQIQRLMEGALGAKALPPYPYPKFPAELFLDIKIDGALELIVTKVHDAMIAQNLKRVDFTNPSFRKQFLDILAKVLYELKRRQFLKLPKVFMDPTCEAEMPFLQNAVLKLRGEIAHTSDDVRVTHHVYPFGPQGDPDDGIQYMRNLKRIRERALVHWWYYPDSYDELVPADSAPEILEPNKQPTGPWKVYSRWVKDSAKFNEWMNPIDYEVDDSVPANNGAKEDPKFPTAAASDELGKRKREASEDPNKPGAAATGDLPAQESKPLAGPPAAVRVPEIAAGEGVAVAPGVIKQRLLKPDPRAADPKARAINLSQAQAAPHPGTARGDSRPGRPLYAAWFDQAGIHFLEKNGCPDFFLDPPSAERNPEVYKQVRNSLVEKYAAEPSKQLTFGTAEAALQVDSDLLLPVWRFLDCWGIINFQAAAAGSEDPEALQKAAAEVRAPEATLHIAEALFKSRPLPGVQQGLAAIAGPAESAGPTVARESSSPRPSDSSVKQARRFCHAKPDVDCTQLRYHCTRLPGVDLCPEAFAEGRFPPGCCDQDFLRIDQEEAQEIGHAVWSDQDTLLLLEGLELFGDNWAEIAEHVATKSQVQCITHFLRLPIEDQFLDKMEELLPDRDEIPFADHGNPVMAQVAFTAAMVGPEIGAAAAQGAIEVLASDEGGGEPSAQSADSEGPLSEGQVRRMAVAALEAAAVKARLVAATEEAEVLKLLEQAAEVQQALVSQRLSHFAQLQQAMEVELHSLQMQRESSALERIKSVQAKQHSHAASVATAAMGRPVQPQQHPPSASEIKGPSA